MQVPIDEENLTKNNFGFILPKIEGALPKIEGTLLKIERIFA